MMPKRRTYKTLDEFGKEFSEHIGTDAATLVLAFKGVILQELGTDVLATTPVGPSAEAGARAARHGAAYGHMKNRWFYVYKGKKKRVNVGGESPLGRRGRAVDPGFASLKKPAVLMNDAAHARVIEMGLKQSKPYALAGKQAKEFTRKLGSRKAPRGVMRPAIERLDSKVDQLKTKASQKADRVK